MIKQAEKDLAEELIRKGYLTRAVVDKTWVALQKSTDGLQLYLVNNKLATEKQILECLSSLYKLPTVDIVSLTIEKNVIEKIPVRFAWYFKFMPLKIEGKVLTVATANPMDTKSKDEIRAHLGFEPKVMLAKESDMLEALNKYYGLAADTIERLSKETAKKPVDDTDSGPQVEDLDTQDEDASVSRLVNEILLEAYKKRATDIHIEPYRNKVRVRYRIDGILVDANIPPAVKQFLPAIISRIKIMANLSIVERRLPQDGSAIVKTKEHDLDLRISTIPTPRGESMVIRLLTTSVMMLSLSKLGLDDRNLKLFRALIQRPHGIILTTGPTGSGKTTTLYACLNEINEPDTKIITLEDPIESEIEGITQIQVNPKVNLTFATGLRSVLRHDPDIIMVGEIRDLETAEISIRTALTGHLVFSTLHTNDAASGVTRLIEMGLEPFLVASSLEAFVAQRLIRLICPHCKEEDKNVPPEIRQEIAQSLNIPNAELIKIYHGRGCDQCHKTGYYGRTAIYEVLTINEDIRAAILAKDRADYIKKLAMDAGMVTLRRDGWQKVLAGLTTPAEVLNVTVKDEKPEEEKITTGSSGSSYAQMQARIVNDDVLGAQNEYNSRVYSRFGTKVGIRYSIVRQDEKNPHRLVTDGVEHSSITKDISAGGLRFISGYTLPLGTILDLKIHLGKESRSMDCLAKVCRVEDDNLSSMFNIVVYYLDMSSADRSRLDQFVKEGLLKNPQAAVQEA